MNVAPIVWDNDKLEPVIITYNRAHHLKNTLLAFYEAGLTSMRLHVLDNASTDGTEEVVRELQHTWPLLTYHKNIYNISGNGNILRSMEITSSEYHWVIGDDDEWLLDQEKLCGLLQVLQQGIASIVRLGWLVPSTSRGTGRNGRDLAEEEPLFFASMSMISAVILRRSLVAQYLALAYYNTGDYYPQLVPLIRAIEEMPVTVYTLPSDLMIHRPSTGPGYFRGDLEWYTGWFRTARFFTQDHLKKRFVREVTYYMCRERPGRCREFLWLAAVLLYYKSFKINQWPYLLSMLAYGRGWRIGIAGLMLLNLITPTWLLAPLRKLYFKIRGLPQKTIVVDRSRM